MSPTNDINNIFLNCNLKKKYSWGKYSKINLGFFARGFVRLRQKPCGIYMQILCRLMPTVAKHNLP